jgi:hypothetical protein
MQTGCPLVVINLMVKTTTLQMERFHITQANPGFVDQWMIRWQDKQQLFLKQFLHLEVLCLNR